MKSTRNKMTALVLLSMIAVSASSAWGIGTWRTAQEPRMLQASPGLAPANGFADPAFQRVWQRTDLPVQTGQATDRSWMWGPEGRYSGYEAFVDGVGGRRLVEYFDKSRMEINDPNGDPTSQWFVTNGLLVVEMMSGQITIGSNGAAQPYLPANIPIAGDVSASINAPTYASMASVASLKGNNRAADHVGQPVETSLNRSSQISQVPNLAGYAKYAVYEPTLGHNIPDVFWTFLNQSGVVYENGQYTTGLVIDWSYAMGYPLTEAYWINISVGGTNTWVLAQAYQRRILTYSPNNPPASQVEMGNVGLSYYDWRYNGVGASGPVPTPVVQPPATSVAPTPKPATPAGITINPQEGPSNSTITISGSGFPAYSAVVITALAPDIGYNQTLTTAAADAAGNFQVAASLPSEVAHQTSVTITALANGNTIQASQQFTIVHNPTFTVSPSQVTNVGVVQLKGDDFPANTDVTVTAYVKNPNGTESPATSGKATTDKNGSFSMSYQLMGKAAVGQQFDVVATAPGNIKVSAKPYVSIVSGPTAQVIPPSGPVGAAVTFQGANWQPNRLVSITLQGSNGQTQTLPNAVVTNGAGSFTTQVVIPTAYAGQPYVVLWATDSIAQITMQATYTIVPTPTTPVPPTPVPPKPTPGPPPPIGGLPMQHPGEHIRRGNNYLCERDGLAAEHASERKCRI